MSDAPRAPAIEFQEVYKAYPGTGDVLRGTSFTVGAGEMVFLTGASGAGKTTVIRLLAALERPTGGAVLVNGESVGRLPPKAVPYLRRNLGLVFQEARILFDRSALANVMLPLEIIGLTYAEAAKRARAALERVGLRERERAAPLTLSGGERQRLCIARAIVGRPSILIADEPTANLDAGYARSILELFRSFNRVGVTVLLATHDTALIDGRVLALESGRVGSS